MTRACIVLAKDRVVNDCGCHVLVLVLGALLLRALLETKYQVPSTKYKAVRKAYEIKTTQPSRDQRLT